MGEPWSPEEEATLREHYPAHGREWDGWELLLPGRTRRAIAVQATRLGVRCGTRRRVRRRGSLENTNEMAATAVAALGDWEQTRLALLVATAGTKEKEDKWE